MRWINNPQTLSILGLLIGCILFGMGSLIVAYVDVGAYAMSFWRLAISSVVFCCLHGYFAKNSPNQDLL